MAPEEEQITFEHLPRILSLLQRDVKEIKNFIVRNSKQSTDDDEWMDVKALQAYHPNRPAARTIYDWIHYKRVPYYKDGKRIRCSVSFGGDEYIYHGEPFHGARLEAYCGGIRLNLCEAVINEDEEIDIHTFMGGVELIVPSTVNVVVNSRSFIGGVGNETTAAVHRDTPCLHVIASNVLGGVSIKNED